MPLYSTFYRFICRINEIISLPKAKYQEANTSKSIDLFVTCLKEIQRVVNKYSEDKLFYRIVELTQIIFIKFCINCQGSTKAGANKEVGLQTSDSMKKMNEKMSIFQEKEKNSR